MFSRAGRLTTSKRRADEGVFTEALTRVANKISGALSPVPASSSTPSTTGNSPAKLIEYRSKCYRQLSELNNLKSSGVLTEEEYTGCCFDDSKEFATLV